MVRRDVFYNEARVVEGVVSEGEEVLPVALVVKVLEDLTVDKVALMEVVGVVVE